MTKTTYIETKINLSEGQKQKLANAYKNKSKVTINFKPENADGSDTFYFTKGQVSRIEKAFNKGHGVNINLSNAQIRYNTKHGGLLPLLGLAGLAGASAIPAIFGKGQGEQEGGFLGGFARTALKFAKPLAKPLLKNVVKPFAKGALGSAGAHAADAIFGDGMYLVKRGHGLKLETDGSGLYLLPAAGLVATLRKMKHRGNGLYLVQDGQVQHGGFIPGILPGAIKGIVDLIS